jgi:hypothetical protein
MSFRVNADAFRYFYDYHFAENRKIWDHVEQNRRAYLAALQDEMLFEKPLEGEDKDLIDYIFYTYENVVPDS